MSRRARRSDAAIHASVVVFDLDGTLVDTMPLLADFAADLIAHHFSLPREAARKSYLDTSGLPFHEQLSVILPGDARNRAVAAEFEQRKVGLIAGVTPAPLTMRALERLRAAGYRLAVSSNARQALVDLVTARCGLPVDVALGWSETLPKGRAQFGEICRRLGCGVADLLFVGDSLVDARLAEEAGVAFVARTGTFTPAQFQARWPAVRCTSDLNDLLEWLERRETLA